MAGSGETRLAWLCPAWDTACWALAAPPAPGRSLCRLLPVTAGGTGYRHRQRRRLLRLQRPPWPAPAPISEPQTSRTRSCRPGLGWHTPCPPEGPQTGHRSPDSSREPGQLTSRCPPSPCHLLGLHSLTEILEGGHCSRQVREPGAEGTWRVRLGLPVGRAGRGARPGPAGSGDAH